MIEVAKEAAVQAGKITLELRHKKHKIKNKGSASNFSTEADVLSENKILGILKKAFPNHGFLMEESGEINRNSDFIWVIDPIDGTIPYSSGLSGYGVSIGLLKEGNPILGVINLPAMDQLFWAEKGGGAFLNGKRIYVNKCSQLGESIIGVDVGHIGARDLEIKNIISPIAEKVKYPLMLGCNVLGMTHVAVGIYGAYIHNAYPWDHAAGVAIIKEAGGKVTDFTGHELDWSKEMIDVVASNGLIHDQILDLINK